MFSPPQNTDSDESARYKRAIRTAEELFKKVGFRAVTMELVAREANVAKATLYSYFKNKDELFLAVCARMARLLTHSMAGEIFADLDAAILEMLRAAMAEDPELSPSAKHLARALYFGSADLANRSASAAEMEAELNAFAATHLAGARALAKRH